MTVLTKFSEKTLYDYQQNDLDTIFDYLDSAPTDTNLLYQLPTGGGKTVVFSEIAKRYIATKGKKVVVLTHRIELSTQTSKMLEGFGVHNKIINSDVKSLEDQEDFSCFVAMVETLNNRLQEEKVSLDNIGLVIIDEAHYNSFRKLMKFFKHAVILGVTATPLSSNIKLPMKDHYKKLIVGESITSLIDKKFLAQAHLYNKNVSLKTLKLGINGDYTVGEMMTTDTRIPLISATGSTRMGKELNKAVAGRLGKTILELGGNNAIIITENADLDMSLIGAVFGAVGTAGQRCTSTRRLIIHEKVYDSFVAKLTKAYQQIIIGDPLNSKNHMGPLIDKDAVQLYLNSIEACKKEGGQFLVAGGILEGAGFESGCYVKPCIAAAQPDYAIVQHETFAPILYVMKYKTIEEAIAIQNNVPQGLSSAIMTLNMRESELFLSTQGSDCGIANVNIGTSGAEIGGAFGGEKETGGGRESGSDAWKAYMRRQTNTINWSTTLPLAQGIQFDL